MMDLNTLSTVALPRKANNYSAIVMPLPLTTTPQPLGAEAEGRVLRPNQEASRVAMHAGITSPKWGEEP